MTLKPFGQRHHLVAVTHPDVEFPVGSDGQTREQSSMTVSTLIRAWPNSRICELSHAATELLRERLHAVTDTEQRHALSVQLEYHVRYSRRCAAVTVSGPPDSTMPRAPKSRMNASGASNGWISQ